MTLLFHEIIYLIFLIRRRVDLVIVGRILLKELMLMCNNFINGMFQNLCTHSQQLVQHYSVKNTLFAATPLPADSSTFDDRLLPMLLRKDHMVSSLPNV